MPYRTVLELLVGTQSSINKCVGVRVSQSVLERERGEERQLVSRAIVSTSARHLIALRLLQVSLEI